MNCKFLAFRTVGEYIVLATKNECLFVIKSLGSNDQGEPVGWGRNECQHAQAQRFRETSFCIQQGMGRSLFLTLTSSVIKWFSGRDYTGSSCPQIFSLFRFWLSDGGETGLSSNQLRLDALETEIVPKA